MPDLTPDAEVMTAAEWKRSYSHVGSPVWYIGTLAALEEREALLGERADLITATGKAVNEVTELRKRLALMEVNYSADTRDAEVGALVAKIQRHPKSVAPVVHDGCGLDVFTGALSADGFRSILSHLDSLLPKEPEVVVNKETGNKFRVKDGVVEQLMQYRDAKPPVWERCRFAGDAFVVAQLMKEAY